MLFFLSLLEKDIFGFGLLLDFDLSYGGKSKSLKIRAAVYSLETFLLKIVCGSKG